MSTYIICARLKGQAGVCKFTIKCPGCQATVDYTDEILRDVLTRGVADPEIQLDLLSDSNQNMTLENVFQFIEKKESGKRSASQLLNTPTQGAAASQSSYRKEKRAAIANKTDEAGRKSDESCGYCGECGHGKNAPIGLRRKVCPAFGHTCGHCGKQNHRDRLCRNKNRPKLQASPQMRAAEAGEHESAIFDALCSIETLSQHRGKRAIHLDHHVYDNMCSQWKRQVSQPQPYIKVQASVCHKDYTDLGFHLKSYPKPTSILAMADTGCQSCLAGSYILKRMGLISDDLIPVKMKMHAANNGGINIIGAVILRFTGNTASGTALDTRQITYITDSNDKVFLSREACIALGMISANFPQIGETLDMFPESTHHADTGILHDPTIPTVSEVQHAGLDHTAPCGCPKQTLPPPRPTEMPFPGTEENRQKLTDYLIKTYASSTFNTCKHQPLPLMESPHMCLMVDLHCQPVAHHKAIPVPLHWSEEVKAGLDQDVCLGVIEPVPIGEPVTWCHQMVVCAKKDGTPRRTVDFQALNLHATRETHHTQSPFHQARSTHMVRRKLSSMPGMGTIAFPCMKRTGTSLLSLHHGGVTATGSPHKVTSLLGMDTPGDMTKLWQISPTRPNVLTTPSYGLTPSRRASGRLSTGWTSVERMASSSTPHLSLPSLQMKWNLQVSRLPLLMFSHARNSCKPSRISRPLRMSRIFVPGLD